MQDENLIRYMDLNQIDRTVLIRVCITDTAIVISVIVSGDFRTVYMGWHCWILTDRMPQANWSVCINTVWRAGDAVISDPG